jgi:type II secretory pathway pseudopilin PulG
MPGPSKRHRAQAGTTLIELLVSVLIMGTALVILVGLFSTGVVDSSLAKQDAAAQAAIEYEMEKIGAAQYNPSPAGYSECFASDGSFAPAVEAFGASCPAQARIRADVAPSQIQAALQRWTIQVKTWPAPVSIGKPVSVLKVNR